MNSCFQTSSCFQNSYIQTLVLEFDLLSGAFMYVIWLSLFRDHSVYSNEFFSITFYTSIGIFFQMLYSRTGHKNRTRSYDLNTLTFRNRNLLSLFVKVLFIQTLMFLYTSCFLHVILVRHFLLVIVLDKILHSGVMFKNCICLLKRTTM